MMTEPETIDLVDERVPVSRIQRFLPFLSYSLMGLGGAVAGYYAICVVGEFANAENAGIGRIAGYLTSGMWSITTGLVLALIVGFVAIIAYVAMMFAPRKTASPSSLWLLVVAFFGMVSPFVSLPALIELLLAPLKQDVDPKQLASRATTYGIVAIVLGLATPAIGMVATILPMRSRQGKKFMPLIVMIIIELLMLVAVVYVTMQVRSITRMAMGY